jgi:hypothetical protein
MSSGTLYRVALVKTDVSENVSPPSSGLLRVIGFHSCVFDHKQYPSMETLINSDSTVTTAESYDPKEH